MKIKMLATNSIAWCFGFTCLLFVTNISADEATPAPPSVSQKPLEMMERLSGIAGEWDLQTLYSADNGKNWQDMGTISVTIGYDQKDLMLIERPVTSSKTSFNMVSFITYDQYRQVFRKAAIDDVWGIMDLYTGHIEDGVLILTNLEMGTLFPEQNGNERGFRLSLELTGDNRSMLIESTLDHGKSWHPNFKLNYRRKDPADS